MFGWIGGIAGAIAISRSVLLACRSAQGTRRSFAVNAAALASSPTAAIGRQIRRTLTPALRMQVISLSRPSRLIAKALADSVATGADQPSRHGTLNISTRATPYKGDRPS